MVASSAALSIAILRDSSVDGKSQAAERLVAIAGRTSGGRMGEETARVEEILSQVRQQGDRALLELTERFDGVRPDPLRSPPERLAAAWETTAPALQEALYEEDMGLKVAATARIAEEPTSK